jgi:O-antigen/teichoic acid export membrane protein
VGAAGLSVLLAQAVLNGGPPLVAAFGGTEAEVTALFTALALFRAPYLVALGLTVRATAPLTKRVEQGGRARLRRPALATAAATMGLAGAAFGLAWPLGPPLIAALFGEGAAPSPAVAAATAAGCTLALGGLALTVVLISAGAQAALVASWLAAVGAGAGVLLATSHWGATARVVAAFNTAEAVAVVAAAAAVAAARHRPG